MVAAVELRILLNINTMDLSLIPRSKSLEFFFTRFISQGAFVGDLAWLVLACLRRVQESLPDRLHVVHPCLVDLHLLLLSVEFLFHFEGDVHFMIVLFEFKVLYLFVEVLDGFRLCCRFSLVVFHLISGSMDQLTVG